MLRNDAVSKAVFIVVDRAANVLMNEVERGSVGIVRSRTQTMEFVCFSGKRWSWPISRHSGLEQPQRWFPIQYSQTIDILLDRPVGKVVPLLRREGIWGVDV
jgi:hypothetical protein